MKHCQRHGPASDPYCVDCYKDERERTALGPLDAATCSASSDTPETALLHAQRENVHSAYFLMRTHAERLERQRDRLMDSVQLALTSPALVKDHILKAAIIQQNDQVDSTP